MSGPSPYQASAPRVFLALLVAYVLPVSLIGAVQTGLSATPLPGPARLMGGVLFGVYVGWMFAWPFLAGAYATWFALRMARRDSPLMAVLTGALCGLIVGLTFAPSDIWGAGVWSVASGAARLYSALALIQLGGVTGWTVWRTAYRKMAAVQG